MIVNPGDNVEVGCGGARLSHNVLNIFYATNDKFVTILAVSIASLLCNARSKTPIVISVLVQGDLSTKNRAALEALSKLRENSTVKLVAVDNSLFDGIHVEKRFGIESLYRIVIARLIPDESRALYLDCDTVILGDVEELYNEDLEGAVIGAIPEDFIVDPKKTNIYSVQHHDDFRYCNSGVLLIDLDRYRTLEIEQQVFDYFSNEYKTLKMFPDQNAINLIMSRVGGGFKYLDLKWNFMPFVKGWRFWDLTNYNRVKSDPKIVHFANESKPVNYYRNIFAPTKWDLKFWKYLLKTKFWYVILTLPGSFFVGFFKRLIVKSAERHYDDGTYAKRIKLFGITVYKRSVDFYGSTQAIFGAKFRKKRNLDQKIDLVYTWVDGSDPAWQAKKRLYIDEQTDKSPEVTCEGRFENSDELMYSLRSVDMYAPWINHIYIITDNQIPSWLNTNHPKITVVDHKEILPADVLPTFNSNVIDSAIANIDGLSEHFLFANDDMMFGRVAKPSDFFTKSGNPIVRMSERSYDSAKRFYRKMTPYRCMLDFTNKLMYNEYRSDYLRLVPSHQIDAYSKQTYNECVVKYQELIDRTRSHRFRQSDDLQRHIVSLYAIETRKCELRKLKKWPSKMSRLFMKLGFAELPEHLYSTISNRSVERRIHVYKPLLFCLNDSETCTSEDREHIKGVMCRLFPQKSSFEK